MTQHDLNRRVLKRGALLMLGLACLVPHMALAQNSDTFKFLDAVRKSDVAAIAKAIEVPGVTPINTKDRTTGETPLHIVVGRRDLQLTSYFLTRGAKPDLVDNGGRTPLFIAVEKRFTEGVQQLLAKKANPNIANDSGETPVIRAVQLGDVEIVRLLLSAGADPNRKDSLAGMSAIDYAKQSSRSSSLLEALSEKIKVVRPKAVQGPQL